MKTRLLPLALLLGLGLLPTAFAQTYPTNFSQVQLATGLSSPTAMAFAPDGRLFICQQGGAIRVFKNGALLGTSFASFSVSSSGERGLLGIAFHPSFSTNRYIYIYHTLADGSRNRLSRIRASSTNPDVMESGSQQTILDFDALSSATNHNGGFIKFGTDGKLYIAIGENANGNHAQNLDTYHGKLLRVNDDGSAPADNPYNTTGASEQKKRVWSWGLRNPFTFDIQPGTGKLYVNDVGQNTYEEINDATAAGLNFGWPNQEGTAVSGYTSPVFFYAHGSGDGRGCAITGGAFLTSASNYPGSYAGNFFYLDYCNNWINRLDAANTRQPFATGIPGNSVGMITGPDGNLYFLSRTAGALYRVVYSPPASAPVITTPPASLSVQVGQPATFSVTATGTAPLAYQWFKGTTSISGATAASYTIASVTANDAGTYKVTVSNSAGSTTSPDATLTVTGVNQPPTAAIGTPAPGTTYAAGTTVSFAGSGSDPEDGATLPASAFEWSVVFHHDDHTHPGPAVSVAADGRSGSFVLPNEGETATNVFYRLYLTVRDANNATTTVFRDILPRTSQVTLASDPTGLQLTLDGATVTTPYTFSRVEGMLMNLGVVSPQVRAADGLTYAFSQWQQGGAASQTLPTPADDATYRAVFTVTTAPLRDPDNPANTRRGLDYRYYLGSWNSLPNFNSLTPSRTGSVSTFSLSPRTRNDDFGFVFAGFVSVPADGPYDFFTNSDEGSRLYIGNTLVVDNDGLHPARERSGRIGLKAGLHAIRVEYFERTGTQALTVSYDGPTFAKTTIPSRVLFRSATGSFAAGLPEGQEAVVFPNPASDFVGIQASEDFDGGTVSLFNASGRLLREATLEDGVAELNLENLPAGLYLVQIRKGDRVVTQRLAINR